MKLINGVFQVDDADYDFLMRFTWYTHPQGYALTQIDGKIVYMHRLILNPDKGVDVDHRDHNPANNQRFNLRPCILGQNEQNRPKRSEFGLTSQYKGVGYMQGKQKWRARIANNHIGLFNTEIEAAEAYNKAAVQQFGEFAHLNKIRKDSVQ